MLMIVAFPKPLDLLVSRNCPGTPWKAFRYNRLWVGVIELDYPLPDRDSISLICFIHNSDTECRESRRLSAYPQTTYLFTKVGNSAGGGAVTTEVRDYRAKDHRGEQIGRRIPQSVEVRPVLMMTDPRVLVAFKPTEEHLRQVRNLSSGVGIATNLRHRENDILESVI